MVNAKHPISIPAELHDPMLSEFALCGVGLNFKD